MFALSGVKIINRLKAYGSITQTKVSNDEWFGDYFRTFL